jgi:CheY-like chemotaxis protein
MLPRMDTLPVGMLLPVGTERITVISRTRYDAESLPAIAVTAFSREEERERALAAGFQGRRIGVTPTCSSAV